ncbi:Na+/H+ antiporter NhaC family protein [Radiobacillus kanasensis]|uniref:Na+/H+ antiporter NhaC family protein n=1 Tax=Radiobacillus kanasensis TaxID=2844358 RepID=UPI001E482A17|nr:Na+/H+ antiporter NhaC family protein [Radiobacillus kanasensis]UFT98236.1 Na+/H+ antiporter NhaC family protein [Radiobacillus kanasensis]
MEGTIYSLIPALIMLVLVLLTRKVLLSLGVGIIVGAFLIQDGHIWSSLKEIWLIFYGIFIVDGEPELGSIYMLAFLLLLGVTTSFMTASGGSRAFGEWAINKVRTRKGAQAVPAYLGILIFIDDYFNSLAVGQIARPVTDRYKVSRAKLAYFIDSTSAPVTVISPISSWGAYIIGTIGTILAANNIAEYQPIEAFVGMIPFNFYALACLVLVFLVVYLKVDIGPMKQHEQRAIDTGELYNTEKGDIPGDLTSAFSKEAKGGMANLLVPILTLVLGTVGAMIVTGIRASEAPVGILDIFSNTNVNLSLFIGGVLAVALAWILYAMQSGNKPNSFHVIIEGLKSMLPAIYILILAWMIGAVIDTLATGQYLAEIVIQSSINPEYLPLLLFVVAGIMAFATGTSWGTFGIMLPIAGELAAVTDVSLVLPALSAVLAGSVFGDHCSPISDTTILSSTGAGANHIDHVMTQLPYASISAGAAVIGYALFAWTGTLLLSLTLSILAVVIFAFIVHRRSA